MTRWTIAQLRDKEKYDAWKDDDELIEVDEVDADKAKDKARIKELEEELEKKLDLIDLLNLEIKALNERIVALKGLNKSGNIYPEYGNQDKNKLEDSHD